MRRHRRQPPSSTGMVQLTASWCPIWVFPEPNAPYATSLNPPPGGRQSTGPWMRVSELPGDDRGRHTDETTDVGHFLGSIDDFTSNCFTKFGLFCKVRWRHDSKRSSSKPAPEFFSCCWTNSGRSSILTSGTSSSTTSIGTTSSSVGTSFFLLVFSSLFSCSLYHSYQTNG